jgi:hypothetical protein
VIGQPLHCFFPSTRAANRSGATRIGVELAAPLKARGNRSKHSIQRQNQPGSLSLPASDAFDHLGRTVHSNRRSGAAGCHLAAADQVRSAISRSVLRRNLPYLHWVLHSADDVGWVLAQLLVGAAGISIMTAVAYYRSWSKRVETSARVFGHHPRAEVLPPAR